METADLRSMQGLPLRLVLSTTARGIILLFLLLGTLSLVGMASAVKAENGDSDTQVISLQTDAIAASDICPSTREATDIFHVDGHCSTPCGPQVGTNVPYVGLWQIRPRPERPFAGSALRHLRTDSPDPYPPRIPDHV